MLRTKLALAAIAAALIAAATLAGCGSRYQDYPAPTTWTVTYHGSCYAGYMYDPHELDYLGVPDTCYRMVYPSYPPALAASANFELWTYLLTYDTFLHSGYYYDQYLTPMSSRYQVTIISKTSYLNYTSSFDRTYATQIKNQSAKATWTGGKTGNYTFPSSNSNARNKPLTNGPNNGGSGGAGSPNSRDRTGPITTNTTTRTGGSTSTGKSGSRR